jgi:hypothetical protein
MHLKSGLIIAVAFGGSGLTRGGHDLIREMASLAGGNFIVF